MPPASHDFASKLDALDLSLFDAVASQSTDGDRRSWLAVQRAIRRPSGYTYLEIGSHLGGSIQQHLVDPYCRRIVSIDRRPLSQPDDRGFVARYEENSTARMLDNLRRVSPEVVGKIVCFDLDARDVDPARIPEPADFCFIDGEHTHASVLSDFEFCLKVSSPNAAICFHDALVLYRSIAEVMSSLRARGVPFHARKLGGSTFGLFLRECRALDDPYLTLSQDGSRWIRGRRIRGWLPREMRPAARWVARRLRAAKTS